MPFELPHNFKPNIQEGLDNCCLNGRARTKFVTSIAESMYRFKSYPTGEEYEHVSRQIVKKWSFLNTSTSHVSVAASLSIALKLLCASKCRGTL